jgi:predicted phosphohydrolase
MKILVTADLHYDIARSRASAQQIARRVCQTKADALVLLGDSAGRDIGVLGECLGLFDSFEGQKFLVPGNHCLWCRDGQECSFDRYERILPQAAADAGFVYLDQNPTVLGNAGLVGSIGWYDYSTKDESLGLPLAFYEAKMAPRAAEYYGLGSLIEAHREQLSPRLMDLGVRWMDGANVRLGMTDEQFTQLLLDRMESQIAAIEDKVERIAVFMHHVPCKDLVPTGRPDRFTFAAAYMGSVKFGQMLLEHPKVRDVFCGHVHWPMTVKIQHVTATSVGSTYIEKRLVTLEV